MNLRSAISQINKKRVLLVFPIKNAKEPASLWCQFYPRTKMRWEWDADGDGRVSDLWMLMKKLSTDQGVVYSKWYQGRATFFSRDLFASMLCLLRTHRETRRHLSPTARALLETLESDSPLSTKELKRLTELRGKDNEPQYNRAMRELFSHLLIVGFGEVDDGAFPSLAVGATQLLYEDLWNQAQEMKVQEAQSILEHSMPQGSALRRYFEKIKATLQESADP